ncbi:FHA domain-containing serine/threonine-protein kinase [Isosphaeraceae bacterium EP7]
MHVILRVTSGPRTGKEYLFDRHSTFVVGRSSHVQFPLPDDGFLSRNHFLVEFNPPACYLKDLGSTNGTKLNGVRVGSARLKNGDIISAGGTSFEVVAEESSVDAMSIRCLDCGQKAPSDLMVATTAVDQKVEWYCDRCVDQRRRYPTPPEGFRIERRIGGGGMGEVFLAWRRSDQQPFAIKTMIPTVAASRHAKERFRREQEVMKDLRHPNIVAFIDMEEIDGQFQIIMEYVDGKNALEWVGSLSRPISTGTAARVGLQLLAALDHAHAKGYVHRDIKPSNLLVGGGGVRPKVKLSDFGLAKSFRDDAGFVGLTHQGDIGGSVGFISPDHIRDFRQVKEPADIYSAATTLYYMMSGHYPYLNFDPSRADAYNMILEYPTVPIRAHRPDVPEGFDRVLRKAMEKQPRDRWKSAAAMYEALRPFVDEPG